MEVEILKKFYGEEKKMHASLLPETPSKSVSPEILFREMDKLRQPQLLDRLLIIYLKSETPELPESVLQQHHFQDLTKFNALRACVKYNKIAEFKLLLRSDASIFISKNQKNLSLLHYIASKGCFEFLKILFQERNEDVKRIINCQALDKENKNYAETSLSYALKSTSAKSMECAHFLIRETYVNQANEDGTTPLMVALQHMRSVYTLKMLLAAGAEVRDDIKTKLITLISKNYALKDKGRSECIELLAQKGIDLNAVDELNKPLIWYTCSWGERLATQTLIAYGVDINLLAKSDHFKKNKKEELIRMAAIRDFFFKKSNNIKTISNLIKTILEYLS